MWKLLLVVGALLAAENSGSVLDEIAASGRCVAVGTTPDMRTATVQEIAPGQPPLLSFRVYEGKQRGRFGNTDLMLDDAGH